MKVPTNHKETIAVHSGTYIDPKGQGVNTPIQTSSAYRYRNTEENTYPRYFNTLNEKAVEQKLAALEGGEAALVFSSGMAAISTAILGLLQSGDHIVFQRTLYGGTHNLVNHQLERYGISHSYTHNLSPESFEKSIQSNTKAIYIETPSNPLLDIVSIKAISDIARKRNIVTMIDNTFASPINQNPIDHGIDIVLHSGTKYLGGHSDICFGALITSEKLKTVILKSAINLGGSLNGQTYYLIERSMKTLHLRVERQNSNALQTAEFLEGHSKVKKVNYPGLVSHPKHGIAKEQMSGFGGMLSFELMSIDSGANDRFMDALEMIQPALSLGGVETITCVPAVTSHIKLTQEQRENLGITDQLIRLSIGIEKLEDIIDDLERGLEAI